MNIEKVFGQDWFSVSLSDNPGCNTLYLTFPKTLELSCDADECFRGGYDRRFLRVNSRADDGSNPFTCKFYLPRCVSIRSLPFVIQVQLHSVAAVEANFPKKCLKQCS